MSTAKSREKARTRGHGSRERERHIAETDSDQGDSQWPLFVVLLVFRIVNAGLLQTYFVPDEHWQTTEIAHRRVFGYGALTWEWRGENALRSYLQVAPYTGVYALLQYFQLDSPLLVIYAPRLLQAIVAAVTDFAFYKLWTHWPIVGASRRWPSRYGVAKWTLLLWMLSWFGLYSMTRTLVNVNETALFVCALYLWSRHRRFLAMLLAAVSVAMRPTGVLLYLPILIHTMRFGNVRAVIRFVWSALLPAALLGVGVGAAADYVFYERWTLTWWNFLHFNVFTARAGFYGTHAWHWYWSQGAPTMLLTYSPLVLLGIFLVHWHAAPPPPSTPLPSPLWFILVNLIAYSCLDHKEFRFILPMLPLSLVYAGFFVSWLSGDDSKELPLPSTLRRVTIGAIGLAVLVQVMAASYFSLVHQRGVLDAMSYVRDTPSVTYLYQLMPCHSTPWRTHVHRDADKLRLNMLVCPPSNDPNYVDQADQFFANPVSMLKSGQLWPDGVLPSHIMLFAPLLEARDTMSNNAGVDAAHKPTVASWLKQQKYSAVRRYFHTHLRSIDARLGDVLIYRRD